MFIYFTDPRTPLNTSYCSVVGIQRYLRDNLSSEHHDERFIYCWVVLLSAIWPPPINSLLFSALAHSQSWQRTEKEPLRYHISHRSSLLWHQHTAASFSDAHGLDGIEYSQSECGSPHSHKLTCRTGLELNHAHTKVLDFFSCKLIIPPIILPSHTFLVSNVVQYCSVVVFYVVHVPSERLISTRMPHNSCLWLPPGLLSFWPLSVRGDVGYLATTKQAVMTHFKRLANIILYPGIDIATV